MNKESLTIVTVNYNTSSFIEVSLYALANLTTNKHKIIICDNGSNYFDKQKLREVTSTYLNVELLFRKQSAYGSIGHGEALNILIEKINTPYGVIMDSDTIFLKSGWDNILINKLDDVVKIIGTPPVENPVKPTDFPLTYAVLFDTEVFRSLKIDMRPKNIKIGQDTGWEMREKFLGNGYKGKILEARSTRKYKEGPFKNIICTEYYHEGYKDIFLCDFGRGSSLGAPKYKEWNMLLKLPGINYIARRMKGYKEKKEWLRICKKIIDRESCQKEDLKI